MNDDTLSTAVRIVETNVITNVSVIFAALAKDDCAEGLLGYNESYMDCFCGIPDFEAAAEEAGWYELPFDEGPRQSFRNEDGRQCFADSWQDLCECQYIDTYAHAPEVLEHWFVTPWLGSRLKELDERITEFYGHTLWGRTTSGQAIYLDACMRQIAEG